MISDKLNVKKKLVRFGELSAVDKKNAVKEFFINNLLYILLVGAIVGIQIYDSRFLSVSSIVNIISLSAANLPIALGIAGCIILTGTDLSAGRIVGLTACVAASLLQASGYAGKMFPSLATFPIWAVVLIVIAIGAAVGFVNGFCTAKFNLHPFIVTLATQLITYGVLLMYLMQGTNNGQSISRLDPKFTNFISGSTFKIGSVALPNFVFYALGITVIMWFIWNKTKFGKNMFAVGSNPEAANVSGVNVSRTIILVFTLAGIMYGFTGFIEAARIGSNSASTGLNYELDAIAACVIGGVSSS
jgi:methyl-galactoside transport system permease protein